MKSVMAAKNVDSHLDKFSNQLEVCWRSGAMRDALQTQYIQSCSKYIVEKNAENKGVEVTLVNNKAMKAKKATEELKYSTPCASVEKRKSVFTDLKKTTAETSTKYVAKKSSMGSDQPLRNLTIDKFKNSTVTIPGSQVKQNATEVLDEVQAIRKYYQNHYSEAEGKFDFTNEEEPKDSFKMSNTKRYPGFGSFVSQNTALNSPQSVRRNQRLSDLRNKTK